MNEAQPAQTQRSPDPGRPVFCARCSNAMREVDRRGHIRPVCTVCGWVYYAKQGLGAAVIVESEGRVLLVKRRNEPYAGWWMLPAGYVEYEEFAPQTAARETLEETGLTVRISALFGVYYGRDDPRGHAHLVVYRATAVAGTAAPADDAEAIGWFAPSELPERIAFAGQRAAIADWAAATTGVRDDGIEPNPEEGR